MTPSVIGHRDYAEMDRPVRHSGTLADFVKFSLTLVGIVLVPGILTRYFQVFEYFDLPLIYSIYYGFTVANPRGSIVIGSVLGLLQDSMSGVALGINGFAKTLIGFLAASAGFRFNVDLAATRVLALVLFTFLDAAVKVILSSLGDAGGTSVYQVSIRDWTLSAAFNLLFGMILFGYRSRFGNAAA